MTEKPKKLLDLVRDALRAKHYSYPTEQTFVDWIRHYIFFHYKRHPNEMGAAEIQAFITHLAVERQALSAVLGHITWGVVVSKKQSMANFGTKRIVPSD